MNQHRLFSARALLLLGVVGLACSGKSDGGNGDTFSTGVDPSKNLDEVTPAEAGASCEALAAEMDRIFSRSELTRVGCVMFGLQGASTAGECQDLARQCEDILTEQQKDQLEEGKPVIECDGEPGPITACPITVAQYDRCVNDLLAEFRKQLGGITCSLAPQVTSEDDLESVVPEYQEPASCKEIEDLCPGDDDGYLLGGRIVSDDADEEGDGSGGGE